MGNLKCEDVALFSFLCRAACACMCVCMSSILSCCYSAWSVILKYSVVCMCLWMCVMCAHAFLSLYTLCALELEEFLSAPGVKKPPVRTRANFDSTEVQNLHLDPDWGKQSYTVHPTWMLAPSESREKHCRQTQLSFSSAMQWQTGTWVINFKVEGFWRSAVGIVDKLLIKVQV